MGERGRHFAPMIATGAPLQIFDTLDSTNEEARRRVAAGNVSPVYIMARTQTAGRGRRGRDWVTRPGNLLLTYLGATRQKPQSIALLGFAAGLALAELCDALIGPGRAKLKWPNDLMLGGRKAGGLLLESGALADGRNWVALGIGFNLAAAPEDVGQETAALSQFLAGGSAPVPEVVAVDLAQRLASWSGWLEREGFAPLRSAWLARAHGMGQPARVENGGPVLIGIARDLSAQGELLLELDTGEMRAVAAGDIVFPPKPAA
jgi:BirA family transcriptional regulator, biotin operon repressor / biotin---[acetyl-CoA-carboxylase] ligase